MHLKARTDLAEGDLAPDSGYYAIYERPPAFSLCWTVFQVILHPAEENLQPDEVEILCKLPKNRVQDNCMFEAVAQFAQGQSLRWDW